MILTGRIHGLAKEFVEINYVRNGQRFGRKLNKSEILTHFSETNAQQEVHVDQTIAVFNSNVGQHSFAFFKIARLAYSSIQGINYKPIFLGWLNSSFVIKSILLLLIGFIPISFFLFWQDVATRYYHNQKVKCFYVNFKFYSNSNF